MALLKILKGNSGNLGASSSANSRVTHEGYVYFTTDTGKLYIDLTSNETPVRSDSGASGTKNRIAINAATADYAVNNVSAIAQADDNGYIKYTKNGSSSNVLVYTHPSYTQRASGFYKVTVDNSGHVSAVTAVGKTDLTNLLGCTPTANTGTVEKVLVGDGLQIGDGSGNNYFTTSGVINHANTITAQTGSYVFKKIKYNNTGHITSVTAVEKSDLTNILGCTPTDNTGTVTSITPGDGLVNGATSSTSKNAITTSGTLSIGAASVTNAMLAGNIANAKLVNSSVTIAGLSLSLGGSLSASTLKSALSLGSAAYEDTSAFATAGHLLAVNKGGTGLTSATQGGVLYGSSSSVVAWTGAGTSGYFLQSGGTGAPSWTNRFTGDTFEILADTFRIRNKNGSNSIISGKNYVSRINIGDGNYVWIDEYRDDRIAIKGSNVVLSVADHPAYDATATYYFGTVIRGNGSENYYYICNTDISTAEAFTSSHWTALTSSYIYILTTSLTKNIEPLLTNAFSLGSTNLFWSTVYSNLFVAKTGTSFSPGYQIRGLTNKLVGLWSGNDTSTSLDIGGEGSIGYLHIRNASSVTAQIYVSSSLSSTILCYLATGGAILTSNSTYGSGGIPYPALKKTFSFASGGTSYTYTTSTYFSSNSLVVTIVVTSGESYLNGPISWSSSGSTITLTTTATSGTVSGYFIVIPGTDLG